MARLMPEASDLVWYVYWRYFGKRRRRWLELVGVEATDVFQDGMIGFLRAVRGFRPEMGTAFSTYAVPHILGAMKRGFRDRAFLIRMPRTAAEQFPRVLTTQESLAQRMNRMPTVAETSAAAGLDEATVRACFEGALVQSLSTVVHREEGRDRQDATVEDLLAVAPEDDEIVFRVDLEQALSKLPPRVRRVVELRAAGYSQTEIARKVGWSQAQVSRVLSGIVRLQVRRQVDGA